MFELMPNEANEEDEDDEEVIHLQPEGIEEEECGGGSVVSCLFQRFTTKYARGHMSEIEEGRGGTVVRSLFLNSKNGHLTTILL